MCENLKFFLDKKTGNFVVSIHHADGAMGDLVELKANTTDASQEKHVPVIETNGSQVTVKIGSAPHPMTEEHHIAWVYLVTNQGAHRKCLPVDGEPKVEFALSAGEKVVAAYEYCNLHGLWKADA